MGMMSFLSGLPLIGGMFDNAAQDERNRDVLNAERENTANVNAANQAIAQKQMDFQERMSNTAWQRGTADMVKAGINPILAATAGAASSPTGSAIAAQKADITGSYNAGANQQNAQSNRMNARTNQKQQVVNSALGIAKLALAAV